MNRWAVICWLLEAGLGLAEFAVTWIFRLAVIAALVCPLAWFAAQCLDEQLENQEQHLEELSYEQNDDRQS